MIDTSRHFLTPGKIREIIDGVNYLKMNVLHWHIVDAQSFPMEVKAYPLLNKKGSFSFPFATFSQADMAAIVEYARQRGVRVILETDVPGHTASWGDGYPKAVPDCVEVDVNMIPLNPTVSLPYEIIEAILREVTPIFTEKFYHFGGDEVSWDCWSQDASITKFMKKHNFANYTDLLVYFNTKVHGIYSKYNLTMICWEECLLSKQWAGYTLPKDTIVEVWKEIEHFAHLHDVIAQNSF